MGTTIEDARAGIEEYREARRGLLNAREGEWMAAYDGNPLAPQGIYGTFTEAEDGEPMVARFTDGQKWSPMMAVQRIMPGLYMNCICGTVFDWDDDLVVVYSALSRKDEFEQHIDISGILRKRGL